MQAVRQASNAFVLCIILDKVIRMLKIKHNAHSTPSLVFQGTELTRGFQINWANLRHHKFSSQPDDDLAQLFQEDTGSFWLAITEPQGIKELQVVPISELANVFTRVEINTGYSFDNGITLDLVIGRKRNRSETEELINRALAREDFINKSAAKAVYSLRQTMASDKIILFYRYDPADWGNFGVWQNIRIRFTLCYDY